MDVNLAVCVAYVAQDAFHYLEKHMQETLTLYIVWRFAGNDNKESIVFKFELFVDVESARLVKLGIGGVAGSVRPCTDSKVAKKEKTFEYKMKWPFKPIEANVWVQKSFLIKMSYRKLAEREDERQAMACIQPSCSFSLVLRSILVISVLTRVCQPHAEQLGSGCRLICYVRQLGLNGWTSTDMFSDRAR